MNLHQPYGRPAPGTKTGRVWELCDFLLAKNGVIPSGRQVAEIYAAEGGNWSTAQTQYSHWKRDHEATAARSKNPLADKRTGGGDFRIQIGAAGRIVIPAEIRTAMGVGDGDTLSARIEDGVLILMSPETAIRKAQELVRRHIPEGVSLVDALIAERRAEAARETGQ